MRRAVMALVLVVSLLLAGGCAHSPTTAAPPPASGATSYPFRVLNDLTDPVTILACQGPCRVHTVKAAKGPASLTCGATCRQGATATVLAPGASHGFVVVAAQRTNFLALAASGSVLGCVPLGGPSVAHGEPTVRASATLQCTYRPRRRGLLHRISRWFHRL